MAAKKGAAGLAAWCRQQRPDDSSVYQLVTETIGSGVIVCEWAAEQIETLGWEPLAEAVFETAQSDADARGTSMQYAVRHVRDGRDVGRCALKFIRPTGERDADDLITGDGGTTLTTALGVLMKQNQELHRFALETMRKQVETAQHSTGLLRQAYERIEVLEGRVRSEADQRIAELLEDAAERANGGGGARALPDELGVFVEAFAPRLAEAMAEQHGSKLLELAAKNPDLIGLIASHMRPTQ